MTATYTINVPILEKYREDAYAEQRGADGLKKHKFNLSKHNFFSGNESDSKKHAHIKSCLNKLEIATQEIPEHIGNILYLAEPYTYVTGGLNPQDMAWYTQINEDMMNLYRLTKLTENINNESKDFNITVNHKFITPHDLNLSFESPTILKAGLYAIYNALHNELTDYYSIDPSVRRFLCREPRPTSSEVKAFADEYYFQIRKSAPEGNLRDQKLRLLLEYLNNETNLNPQNKAMPKKLASIIYWALLLFNIIEQPDKEAEKYIISLNNNINTKYRLKPAKNQNTDI